ncbi:hypothetical protein R3P38DRAFT_3241816 [Favolaschia claudopus]|uniref:Uncharacterized protein n=1 Tax=Favolaschia claudopus TaxID=2862362 RepID=A0AAV9Z5S4_9AGAR
MSGIGADDPVVALTPAPTPARASTTASACPHPSSSSLLISTALNASPSPRPDTDPLPSSVRQHITTPSTLSLPSQLSPQFHRKPSSIPLGFVRTITLAGLTFVSSRTKAPLSLKQLYNILLGVCETLVGILTPYTVYYHVLGEMNRLLALEIIEEAERMSLSAELVAAWATFGSSFRARLRFRISFDSGELQHAVKLFLKSNCGVIGALDGIDSFAFALTSRVFAVDSDFRSRAKNINSSSLSPTANTTKPELKPLSPSFVAGREIRLHI